MAGLACAQRGRMLPSDTARPDASYRDDHLLSLRDIVDFIARRRRVIALTMLCTLGLGVLYYLLATKRYRAEALVEIKQPDDSLGLGTLLPGTAPATGQVNPLEEDVTLATKVQELQSDEIDLQVIDQLHLQDTPDFKPSFNPIGWFMNLFATPSHKDAPGTPFLKSPHRRAAALSTFQQRLKVQVLPSTRLISITYLNPDPALAANVANTLATELEDYGYKTKQQSTLQLSSWLGKQLESVRDQANQLQNQEMQLRRETQSYSIGGTNAAGQTTVYSPVLDALQQSTTALSEAESNSILRGAVDRVVRSGDPTLISGLAGSGLLGSGNPQSTTSLNLIVSLQTQEALQEQLISQDSLRFGDKYPKLIEERAQLAALQASLKAETTRLARRAANDYSISRDQERLTRAAHDALIKRASDINDKFLQYEVIRQQAQDARQLYTDLNRRLLGAGISATAQAGDMSIVSAAFAPDKPGSPRGIVVLGGSLFLGLLGGTLLALFLENRDDRVRSATSIESALGVPVYMTIPTGGARGTASLGREVIDHPQSAYAEAFRGLRTTILLSNPTVEPRTILITGSSVEEGKVGAAINLAATYARSGKRTLLVEMDLARPVLAAKLGLTEAQTGLSNLLAGQQPSDWSVAVPGAPNLFCIPGGRSSADVHDLMSSDAMKEALSFWQAHYDIVVLDGPPLVEVNDSLLLVKQVDLLLVVARRNESSMTALRKTHELLNRLVRTPTGVILEGVSAK